MNTITGLLIDGGLAGSLGWIVAAGMVLGVILGNGMLRSVFGKFMLLAVTYLAIQEITRYSYFQRVSPSTSILTPIGFTCIVSIAYLTGLALGRLLLYLSERYLANRGENNEIVNSNTVSDMKLD